MPDKKVYLVMRSCINSGVETHWVFDIYDSSDKALECVRLLNDQDVKNSNSTYRNYIQEWRVK